MSNGNGSPLRIYKNSTMGFLKFDYEIRLDNKKEIKMTSILSKIRNYINDEKLTLKLIKLISIKAFKYLYLKILRFTLKFRMQKTKLSKRIIDCKNVHFMYNDKFTNSTIDFINKHFSKADHLFLVYRDNISSHTQQKFPRGENIIEFTYDLLNPKDFVNKKLIFHSLMIQDSVFWLYNNSFLLNHSYWMAWGGDLYGAPTDEANNFVRQNIYGIGSFGDNDWIKKNYGTHYVFFDTNMAVSPNDNAINLTELRDRQIKNNTNTIVIQINHSVDDSTLEMLDILAKFKNEDIHIRTILSYSTAGKMGFKYKIIDKGNELFGSKFSYIDKMMPPRDYAEYLAGNDILILYQNHQQGGANLRTSIILGKKVFVRSDVTTTQHLEKNGITVFDSNKIKDMNFYEFSQISQDIIANNIKNTELFMSPERIFKDMSEIFDDSCPALL